LTAPARAVAVVVLSQVKCSESGVFIWWWRYTVDLGQTLAGVLTARDNLGGDWSPSILGGFMSTTLIRRSANLKFWQAWLCPPRRPANLPNRLRGWSCRRRSPLAWPLPQLPDCYYLSTLTSPLAATHYRYSLGSWWDYNGSLYSSGRRWTY